MAAPPAKSRVIFVHRNGEPVRSGEKTPDKGLRMVLHPVKMRDFEQLKSEMTARVQLVTGAVRRVYDRQGVEITALEDFQDQGHYIACGGEKLKAESLAEGASPKKGTLAPTGGASTPSRAPLHRDNTPEKGKILWFYRNGDRHHSGAKFVVHSKRYKRFDQLLTDLSLKVTLPTGAVRRLVTPGGELITELDQLQEGQKYIACGGEKFDPDNMPRAITGDASPAGGTPSKRPSLGGSSTPSGHSPAVRPSPKSIEKFGIQTEKGKVIWAYQNGDKHHKGVKLVIHAKKYKTLDQLKVQMSSQLALPTGPVQRIYAFHSLAEKPVEVKNLADFVDGGEYVVCGPEKFNKEAIPTTLLELAGKRDKLQNGGGHATSTSTTTTHSHAADDDDDEDHHHAVPAAREPVAHVPEPVHHEPAPAPAPAVHHEPAPAPAVHVPEPAPAPAVHHEPEPVAHAPEPVVHQEPEPVAVAADDDTF